MKALIFDTETGGLDSRRHSVLSIGGCIADFDKMEIVETWERYVKLPSIDDYSVTPKAMEVNGLDLDEVWRNGIPPEEIADEMVDFYLRHGCSNLGGHNVQYDVRMTARQIFKCEPEEFERHFTYRYLDSLPVARLIADKEFARGATLGSIQKALGIDMKDFKGGLHTALFDAVLSAKVMFKFRELMLQAMA